VTGGARRKRARRTARDLAGSRPFQLAARAGLIASGLLNLILAAIAIAIAAGVRRGSGDGGALEQLARLTGGVVLLWLAAIALLALGLWQAVQIVAVSERHVRTRWVTRGRHALQAIAYVTVGVVAVRFALGGPDDGSEARRFSRGLLAVPGGAVLLALIGVGIAVVGVVLVVIGLRRRFLDNDMDAPAGRPRTAALVVGMIGYLGRGLVVAVIGGLWVRSALSDDPALATGVDGAFAELARNPVGLALLIAIAVGFVGFALYCGLRARYPKLTA
jgi:hypothetical protein